MKNGRKHHKMFRMFFLHKTNKKCIENQKWNVLYIRWYDITYAEFKTL